MKIALLRFTTAALACWGASFAAAQTVSFDFDSGTPALTIGLVTPLEQTSGGIKATFSSPGSLGPAFSVQNAASTQLRLSKFSGMYLYDNAVDRSTLRIQFSRNLTAITFTFATNDYEIEVPSNVQAIAYLDSNQTPAVGSALAHGTYSFIDTMPMGTLTYDSGGRPFNLVEITIPLTPRGATTFFVDNIIVTPAGASPVITSVSAASYASAAPVAPGSIASGFGQGMSSQTALAGTLPLPTNLANTTVAVRDSAGTERLAPLFYVSPSQINYLVPDGTAAGIARVTVTSGTLPLVIGSVDVSAVAPGLFTANQDGKGVPAAEIISVAPDQTQTKGPVAACGAAPGSCTAVPIDLGPAGTTVILTLYGTGIRNRSSLSAVTARVGAYDASVVFAGAQPEYVGLDQVNVVVPRALAGLGDADVVVTVDGKAANTVRIKVK